MNKTNYTYLFAGIEEIVFDIKVARIVIDYDEQLKIDTYSTVGSIIDVFRDNQLLVVRSKYATSTGPISDEIHLHLERDRNYQLFDGHFDTCELEINNLKCRQFTVRSYEFGRKIWQIDLADIEICNSHSNAVQKMINKHDSLPLLVT